MSKAMQWAACWLGCAVIAGSSSALAQTYNGHPDLGGIWEHSFKSKVQGESPQWTPEGKRLLDDDVKNHWPNGVSDENHYCLPAGMPFMMSGSEGFDIASGPHEVLIVNEERPSPRHIYTDGRKHPDLETFDRTTVGDSVGHWEGDELVVDTIGFLPGATVQYVRSEQTHLVERYRLVDGGQRLHITFTWDDPKLLSKPWTYEYNMERAPADRVAQEYYCDPRDPARSVH